MVANFGLLRHSHCFQKNKAKEAEKKVQTDNIHVRISGRALPIGELQFS